ncbi:hypothetical protein [Vibrio cyclitrophicus]|uniref:hypothetical protein n=1 Tax=Vibrio cyclitrophicus TaxID=47951 RepID=UPI0011B4EACF|nr:hypothetical protein [Vibrio cyclitrophicus]
MNAEELKLQIKNLLLSIYRRVGITKAKARLAKLSIDTSPGWDALVIMLLEDTSKHKLLHKALLHTLEDLLMYGSKLFECYELDYGKIEQLCSVLNDKKPGTFVIEPLVNIDSYRPEKEFDLFAKEENKDYVTYYFLHYAECTEQVVLEQNAIKDNYCYEEGFDKIIATTKGKRVFVNTLRIDKHSKKVYSMIDRADEVGLSNLRKVKATFITHINAIYENTYGELFFHNKLNLFDKVEALYDNSDLGVVSELKFLCPSGASRYEKLSQKGDLKDLREEVYHKAGMKEIKYIIEPFYITMNFDFGELSLLGRKSMVNNIKDSPLTEGILRNCFSNNNYSILLQMLDDA